MKKHFGLLAALSIIGVASIIIVSSSQDDSFIIDEIPHIGAAYSYLVKHDMRLNPEHPPLAKDLAAFPLLFLPIDNSVFETPYWQQAVNDQWNFGKYFLYGSKNNPEQIKFWAKLPMILFFILTALLIFLWTRSLYNQYAALLATILFSFSPTVMAHARVIHFDSAAMFGALCAIYFFIQYLKNQTRKNFFCASFALGIAFVTKFSMLLLIPYVGIVALIYGMSVYKEVTKKTFYFFTKIFFIILAAYCLIVIPLYAFHVSNYPPQRQARDTKELLMYLKPSAQKALVIWAADKPVLRVAAQYGLGVLLSVQRTQVQDITYFLGKTSDKRFLGYFPTVYFLKEPLAWWFLVLFACGCVVWGIRKERRAFGKFFIKDIHKNIDKIAIVVWIILYWFVSIVKGPNIGVRYLLSVYPFMIILVSGQISSWYFQIRKNRIVYTLSTIILTFLLSWYIVENIKTYPFYFTYFNQVAGGPQGGYQYAVDSNLDWGQDLFRLSNWVKEQDIKKIELSYFGWADPVYYLGNRVILTYTTYTDEKDFKKHNQTDGWVAVSANFLQWEHIQKDQPWPYYGWLKKYTPVTVIGNSIFVYHVK